MEFKEFSSDKKTIYAVMKALEIIGEATKSLPDNLKNKYPEIPWKFMAETSDRVVHSHAEADLPIIWSAAKKNAPSLQSLIEEMLEDTDTIESREAHIDVNQTDFLSWKERMKLKKNSKLKSLKFLAHTPEERKKRQVILMFW